MLLAVTGVISRHAGGGSSVVSYSNNMEGMGSGGETSSQEV